MNAKMLAEDLRLYELTYHRAHGKQEKKPEAELIYAREKAKYRGRHKRRADSYDG